MELVEPITEIEDIDKMKKYFLYRNYRNYILFNLGINCGLRISDLLKLKVKDVYKKDRILLRETKTGKRKQQKLSPSIYDMLQEYVKGKSMNEYLFKSRQNGNKPITRQQARNILKTAAAECEIDINVATHTLRKTFGYHFYKKTKDVALLQDIFNHSAPSITLIYIGIKQENMDNAMVDFFI